MHRDCQSQPKLFWIWFRQFREQTETLPLTIITRQFLWPWNWNRKSSLWLTRWKRTKRAVHPASWQKQMNEEFNMHLTMQTISLCYPLLQRKTRGSSSFPLCIPEKTEADTEKEKINVFYNQEKSGVDNHDQMCSLYTTARKTNRWPMRLFYGMIDSATLNTFDIFTENVPKFGAHKKDKRQKFLKEFLFWSFHRHVRDWKCSKHRNMWNTSFGFEAFYRHPHQLQAPPSVIQHSARAAIFVPDQKTGKLNSSAMSAITLCAKITANGCATNARSKS